MLHVSRLVAESDARRTGFGRKAAGEALGVSKTAAGEIVSRAEVIGLTWPLPQLVDGGELERRLFTAPGEARSDRPAPDWAKLHGELKRRSVTLVAGVPRGASGRLRL